MAGAGCRVSAEGRVAPEKRQGSARDKISLFRENLDRRLGGEKVPLVYKDLIAVYTVIFPPSS